MGFFFSIRDANIVAYLTDQRQARPPRTTAQQLYNLMGAMKHGGQAEGFISSDRAATLKVKDEAGHALDVLERGRRWGSELLEDAFVEATLVRLKRLFSAYDLFGLTVRGGERDAELDAFAMNAAYSSGHRALFLITRDLWPDQPLEVLDPFKILAPLVEDLGKRPGMLFWNGEGTSLYAPLDEAQAVYAELLAVLRGGSPMELAGVLQAHRRTHKPKRILHISDLHLGTNQAAENQQLLLQRLQRVAPSVDRVVITGDLFDEPKREYSIHFKNFSYALRQFSNKSPVIVPGNHDQKTWGNVARDLQEVADLEWDRLVVDDDMGTVFFCFDSSRDADWARGKVTDRQKRDVAVEYGARLNQNQAIEKYLNVALVHHHPFSFEAEEKSLLNRTLRLMGKSDEDFLCMEDGPEFVDWCARKNIPLILHGHKHIPRHVIKRVWVEDRLECNVSAVGCGSSLGAEGKPLSYNVVTWDHNARLVGVSCFADPGDGGGFVGQKLAVFNA